MSDTCVHIVDDDRSILHTFSFAIGAAGFATRIYTSAEQLADRAASLAGCVVTDVRMLGLDGVQLVRILREEGFQGPIIVVTGFGDVELAVQAMKEGADDFLKKPFGTGVLVDRIKETLAKRESLIANDLRRGAFRQVLAKLSPRQKDVLTGIVEGKPNKVIARDLGLSVRTVEGYRGELMLKTGASNLSELVRLALIAGWGGR